MYGDNFILPYLNSVAKQDLIKVNGIEGARMYPVVPNSRIALFDANEDIFYIKSADAGGYAAIESYEFHRKEPAAPAVESNKYVTVEDFEKFKEELTNGKFIIQSNDKPNKYYPTWTASADTKHDSAT